MSSSLSLSSFGVLFAAVGISSIGLIGATTTECYDQKDISSCAGVTLSVDDLECWGYGSCYGSTITSTGYVDMDGYLACHQCEIESDSYTYCNGAYACKYAHIECDDYIQCDGHYSCKFTELTADRDNQKNIYCDGEYACRLSEVFGAYYLYASGPGALSETSIDGVQRIYSYGYLSLNNADIDTDGISNAQAILYGYYDAYNATYTCASGSSCYIYCYSSTACKDMKVYIYGSVSITCDSSYDCPTEYDMTSTMNKDFERNEKQLKLIRQERKLKRIQEKNKEMKLDRELHASPHQVYELNNNNGAIRKLNNNSGNNDSLSMSTSSILMVGIIGAFIGALMVIFIFVAKNKCMTNNKKMSQSGNNYTYQSVNTVA